ncbi:hypothetical protein, partial [Salmonella enterica]|uniref:hypothetical protein n=1 Tax=Salmonella enterica TaxID=28901 RepID=UPI0020A3E1A6
NRKWLLLRQITSIRPALTILLVIPFLLCCCSGPGTRKTLSIPQTPGELLTGCYYIVDDSTGVKKSMVENGVPSSYYLDPRPVVTA